MIARLSGAVFQAEDNHLVVDVSGVGYHVHVSSATWGSLTDGARASLQIYTHVSDDAIRLFGFENLAEKALFMRLIGVSKVGPKMAMGVLSAFSAENLASIIVQGDAKRLSLAPGIGKKTAERIVLELKDRVSKEWQRGVATSMPSIPAAESTPAGDAIEALLHLGYSQGEADQAVSKVVQESDPNDGAELVKQALRHLSPRV